MSDFDQVVPAALQVALACLFGGVLVGFVFGMVRVVFFAGDGD